MSDSLKFFLLISGILSLIFPSSAMALPTMLNSIPTTGILEHRSMNLQLAFLEWDFKRTPVPKSSMIYCLEYGLAKNVEIGFDYTADQRFHDAALYPRNYNLKWRILSQDEKHPFAIAIGNMYGGGKDLPVYDLDGTTSVAYQDSPYIVFGREFKDFWLTIGYQKNLGYFSKTVDVSPDGSQASSEGNDGLIVGFNTDIIKSENHPVTLMLDYYGGSAPLFGAGVYLPITKDLYWGYSFFRFTKGDLPHSGAEMPNQHWLYLSYTFPLFK